MFDFLKKPTHYRIDIYHPNRKVKVSHFRIMLKYKYIPFEVHADTMVTSKNFLMQFFNSHSTAWSCHSNSEKSIDLQARCWYERTNVTKRQKDWKEF